MEFLLISIAGVLGCALIEIHYLRLSLKASEDVILRWELLIRGGAK
jgi:hypothetical protein